MKTHWMSAGVFGRLLCCLLLGQKQEVPEKKYWKKLRHLFFLILLNRYFCWLPCVPPQNSFLTLQ